MRASAGMRRPARSVIPRAGWSPAMTMSAYTRVRPCSPWARIAVGGAAAGVAGWLLGCAVRPPGTAAAPTFRTPASDQTDADRRAQVRLELAGPTSRRGQLDHGAGRGQARAGRKPDLPEAFNLRGLIYASMGETRWPRELPARAAAGAARRRHDAQLRLVPVPAAALAPKADAQFAQALAQPQYRDSARTLLARACARRAPAAGPRPSARCRGLRARPGQPRDRLQPERGAAAPRRTTSGRASTSAASTPARAGANAQSLWLAARIEHRWAMPTAACANWAATARPLPAAPRRCSSSEGAIR
jgi:type IV pilus assembly protein PilF